MTLLDSLLDARLSEAFEEHKHPRGPGGRWIALHHARLDSIGVSSEGQRTRLKSGLDALAHAHEARGAHADEHLAQGWALPEHVAYYEHPTNRKHVRDTLDSLTRLGVAERSKMRGGKYAYRVADTKNGELPPMRDNIGRRSTVPKSRGANPARGRAPGAGAEGLSAEAQGRVAKQQKLQRQLATATAKGETAVIQGLRREIARLGKPGAR